MNTATGSMTVRSLCWVVGAALVGTTWQQAISGQGVLGAAGADFPQQSCTEACWGAQAYAMPLAAKAQVSVSANRLIQSDLIATPLSSCNGEATAGLGCVHSAAFRRRSALTITETELTLIAALAIIGLSRTPKTGYRIPAATGTPSAL